MRADRGVIAEQEARIEELEEIIRDLVQNHEEQSAMGTWPRRSDVFRKRMRFPELERTAIDLARTHRAATLLIEDAASGTQLLDTLRGGAPAKVPSPIPRKPEGDKISRALGVSSMVQSGRLFLPKQAHWLGEFTSELLGFPATRHDDQVDALTQLLVWVRHKDMYREPPLCGPILMYADGDGPMRSSDEDWPMPYGAINDPWGAY